MHVCMYVTAVCQSNANILFKTTVLISLIQNILDDGYFPKVFFNFQNIDGKDYVQRLQIWLNPVVRVFILKKYQMCSYLIGNFAQNL